MTVATPYPGRRKQGEYRWNCVPRKDSGPRGCRAPKIQKESRLKTVNCQMMEDVAENGRRGHALHSKDYCSSALHTVELMKSVIGSCYTSSIPTDTNQGTLVHQPEVDPVGGDGSPSRGNTSMGHSSLYCQIIETWDNRASTRKPNTHSPSHHWPNSPDVTMYLHRDRHSHKSKNFLN